MIRNIFIGLLILIMLAATVDAILTLVERDEDHD